MRPACVFIEKPSSLCSNPRVVGRTTWTRAFVFLFCGLPSRRLNLDVYVVEQTHDVVCDLCGVFLFGRSFLTHLSCDVTHWRVAQAILHSLFSHFNHVFSLPLFDPSRYFPTSNLFSLSLSLSFSLLLFCFVSMVFVSCFFVVAPFFHSRCNDRVDVCSDRFGGTHVCLGHVWAMFPTVSCLPLTLVLSLIGVDSATFFGFPPDVALVRVTFDIEQEVLFLLCVCCHLFWKNGSYVTFS